MPGLKPPWLPPAWACPPFSLQPSKVPSDACPATLPLADSQRAISYMKSMLLEVKWARTPTQLPFNQRHSTPAAVLPYAQPARNAPRRNIPNACSALYSNNPTSQFSKTPSSDLSQTTTLLGNLVFGDQIKGITIRLFNHLSIHPFVRQTAAPQTLSRVIYLSLILNL